MEALCGYREVASRYRLCLLKSDLSLWQGSVSVLFWGQIEELRRKDRFSDVVER